MKKEEWNLIVDFVEEVIPRVEYYRSKNVTKYNAEKALDEGDYRGDYVKMERYKNRVRLTDIFLPALRTFLNKAKALKESSNKTDEIV